MITRLFLTTPVLATLCALPMACNHPVTTVAPRLRVEDLKEGAGPAASMNDSVLVDYTGWFTNGKEFDSSRKRGPLRFRIGVDSVIEGWHKGLVGMRVGGKRKLWIPPALAYGAKGKGDIPPNAELVFEIELLQID